MLAEDLDRLKQELKAILPEEGISTVIKAIKTHIPSDAPKFNVILQLESRLNEANLKRVKGVLSEEQLQVQYNQLRNDLLTFIDDLSLSDFSKEAAKKAKTGSVLYKVPHEMELNQRSKCIVRLAYEESVIIQNIDLDKDTTLQSVRISDTMEVAILDPEGGTNFKITSISSPEQFLEDDDYSEWVFYVTPLTVGSHPIVLRISVIEMVGDKEKKKEIVLEEIVTIVTEPIEEDEELSFQNAGYSFAMAGIAPAEAAAGGKGKSSGGGGATATMKKYSMVLGAFTVLIMASWAMGLFTFVSWQEVLWRDTLEGYETFMLDHPDSKYFPLAKQHLALRKAKNDKTENGLLDFIIDNPESELVKDAVTEFKKRSNDNIKERIKERVRERSGKPKRDKSKEKKVKEEVIDTIEEMGLGIDTSLMDAFLDSVINQVEEEIEPETTVVPDTPQTSRPPIEVPSGLGTPKKKELTEEEKEVILLEGLASNMVFIEGGKFTMGCTEDEQFCDKTSRPSREVKVKDFQMCKYEVTQELWATIMGDNPSYEEVLNCPQCPVENVSYKDVQKFIKKLNRKTNRKYRLPSEAEWEYAARGGQLDVPSKYSGSDNFSEVAWHVDNCGKRPQPVGRKKPNELGLYDMTGNVQEWCEDNWHSNYIDAPNNGKAWTKADGYSPYRLYRGGGWNDDAEYSLIYFRELYQDTQKSHLLGFRLASDK